MTFAAFAAYMRSSPADPDTFAFPDAACAVQLPWQTDVAWVPADVYCRGQPIAHAPRVALKAQIAKAAEAGLVIKTGVECEFFLLSPDGTAPGDPLDTAVKPAYEQQALMRRFDLISTVCDYMQALGWGAFANDHEDGNGQARAGAGWMGVRALLEGGD